LDQPDTVLVAPAQYNSAIRDNTLFSEFMQTLFFSRTILFIGASLEGIEAYLQGIALPNAVPREHYALVAVSDNAWRAKADLLQRRYGIKVLPFTPTNDFSELKEFVDKLVEKVVIDEPGSVARGPHVSKLKRITLKNIGPFESLALDLELDAKEKWHVFLGDNGVGKSTVLKAVALALCGKDAQPYAGRLLRYDSSEDAGQTPGTITLETDNKTSYVTTIRRNDRTGQVELTSNTARPLEAEGWLAIGFPPLRTTSWEVAPKGPEAEIKTTSRNWNPVQPLSPALRDTLIAELNQLIGGQSLYDRKRFRGVQWQEKPKEREVLMKSLVKEVEAGISQKWDWVTDLTSFNRLLLEEIYPGEIPRSLKAE
jgi:energy-coupling factor transporter ATP-binding protein EcfA2